MAKNIIIFLICLLIPSFASGGTWDHRIVKVKYDIHVNGMYSGIVEFIRSPSGDVRNVTFTDFLGADIDARIARKKWNLEANWSVLNNFDMGNDGGQAKEILWILVTSIRNNPSLTITQD